MSMKDGVIYHKVKDFFEGKNVKIAQRKGAEDNKIKFREEFITKCKRGYRSLLVKHYIRKEADILAKKAEYPNDSLFEAVHGSQLEKVVEKKMDNVSKLEEHNERIKEIQKIKEERKAEKENEATKVVDPVDPVVTNLQTPVVDPAVAVVQTPVVDPSVAVVQAPVADPAETPVFVSPEEEQIVQRTINQVAQNFASQFADTKNEESEKNVADSSAQELQSQFSTYETEFGAEWKNAMDSVAAVVKNYNSKVQRASAEALAKKQSEIDEVKNVRDAYVEENAKLKDSNLELSNALLQKDDEIAKITADSKEKDSKIDSLVLENRNKDIVIAKLNEDMQAMSAQFRQMQEMFNNFQTMMGNSLQLNGTATVENQAVQKTLV